MTPPVLLQLHADELAALVGVKVEIAESGTQVFVLVHDMPLPDVYSQPSCTALLMTDALYPRSAMDMFWLEEAVARRDGRAPDGADSLESYVGRTWRRYSWHRNGVWRTLGNPLLDHYEFMQARLAMEVAA